MPLGRLARRYHWLPAVILCLVAAPAAWATDFHWAGAGTGGNTGTDPGDPTTQWSGAGNWQERSTPNSTANVYLSFANAGTVYTPTLPKTVATLHVDGSSPDAALRFPLSTATQTVSGSAYVGETLYGHLIQTSGTQTINGQLYLGMGANASGTYDLGGNATLSVPSTSPSYQFTEYVGYDGAGTFNQSGGTHTVKTLCLGFDSESSGTYNLSGTGALNVGYSQGESETIGYLGSATFNQTGGTHTAVTLILGSGEGYPALGSGTYNLSSGSLSAGEEYIGDIYGGTGMFTQTGGTHTVNFNLYLASAVSATYSLSLGSLHVLSAEYVGYVDDEGYSSSGTFSQSGGTHTVDSALTVAAAGAYSLSAGDLNANHGETVSGAFAQTGGTHTVKVLPMTVSAGGSYTLSAGNLNANAGENLLGAFAQTGGTHSVIGNLSIGSTVTYSLNGGSLSVTGNITGTGKLCVDNGSLTVSGTVSVASVYYGYHQDATSVCAINNSSPGAMYVGYSGAASLTQAAGTSAPQSLWLGYNAYSSGTYTLSDTGVLTSGKLGTSYHEYIGYSGTGTFNQNGGTHSVTNNLYLGYNPSVCGSYSLSSGSLSANADEVIGYAGTGTFTQTGGTHTVSNNLYLGYNEHSSGTYELSNSGALSVNPSQYAYSEYIGYSGAGTFTQNGGTHTAKSDLFLGYNSGARGTYNLSSGELECYDYEFIGVSGTGTFTQTGGQNDSHSTLRVGYYYNGTYALSGGTLHCWFNERIGYWYNSFGSFTQTGGSHEVDFQMSVGAYGGVGTFDLSGGDLLVKYDETIGDQGPGTMTQSGGTNTVNGSFTVGNAPGTYVLSGSGVLTVGMTGSLECIGGAGHGTFTQTGGTHTVGSHIELGSTATGVGTYEMAGGSLTAPTINVGVAGQGIFRWTGGTLDVQDIEIGGTGSRFSVGQTAQFAGTLHANGGSVEVDLGDTLTLLGEFGTTQDQKTVTKDGAGALRIAGQQVYAAGAILSVVEGTVFMDTAAGDAATHNLEVDAGGGGSDALIVFEADEYLSMLHIMDGGTARLGDGCHFLVLDTLWIDGFGEFQNVTLTNTPEPATMALVAFGGPAAMARRVRKRRSR